MSTLSIQELQTQTTLHGTDGHLFQALREKATSHGR